MHSGFSSSGCASNQAKEGLEDIQGNEYSTGGNYSFGMSSSGSINNQLNSNYKNEDNIQKEQCQFSNDIIKIIQFKK